MASLMLEPARETEDVAAAFRAAMRGVASTVTLIAVEHAGRRYGMTATAMMSVSLEPPAFAICINRSASIHEPLRRRGVFSVNVLSDRQQYISQHFARSKAEDRFDCGDWNSYEGRKASLSRLPFLADANAVFFGHVSEQITFGTHTLFIAQVDESARGLLKQPLVYLDGSYGSFSRIGRETSA